MREPTYFILAALQDGPLHGYGIIKRTQVLSDGRLTLAAGTLYGALDRLVETGLVTAGRRIDRARRRGEAFGVRVACRPRSGPRRCG
jgi:DNA-binding PadR family transcriptional regulator